MILWHGHGFPVSAWPWGYCLSCSSLHSSALTLSSKMAGSPVIDCKLTRICCQNCVECELHPVFCVNTKYLNLTLCTRTESRRARSTAPRCSSGIEYKNQDVTAGCAWPCRVTTFQAFLTATDERFSLPRMNTFHCHEWTLFLWKINCLETNHSIWTCVCV